MDITRYDVKIRKLYDEHQEYLQKGDAKALNVLKKMLKYALELGDDELIGYVYHSMAFVEHFIVGNYKMFLKDIKLSASYLLKCDNQEELMHVYYLVALDAMNKGLFDLAYQYFNEARSIAYNAGNETSAAILDESIAHILLQIEAYKEARHYLKRSFQGIKKDKKHNHYYSNYTSCMMNDGIACLCMGDLEKTKKIQKSLVEFMDKNSGKFTDRTLLYYELFKFRVLVKDNKIAEVNKEWPNLLKMIKEMPQIYPYMDEISHLASDLLKINKGKLVGELIKILKKHDISEDAIDASKLLIDLEIDYLKKSNKKEKLEECYKKQTELYRQLTIKKKEVNQYVRGLVSLINNITLERDKVAKEKATLLNLASIDALTNISNRYGANIKLDEAFESAYRNKYKLGVVYIDVDSLKKINDTQGHQAGDECLINFAKALNDKAKANHYFAARFGGDEFILIFENRETSEIEEYIKQLQVEIPVSFSSGVYNEIPRGKNKSWDFLTEADKALYNEKESKL